MHETISQDWPEGQLYLASARLTAPDRRNISLKYLDDIKTNKSEMSDTSFIILSLGSHCQGAEPQGAGGEEHTQQVTAAWLQLTRAGTVLLDVCW